MYLNLIDWLNQNYWWPLILLIFIVAILVIILKPRIPEKESIDSQEYQEKIIECLGGIENIEQASLDGNRSKFSLKSVEKINIEGFKEMGATGVFISGNKLKMLLPFPVEKIIDKINSDISGGKL